MSRPPPREDPAVTSARREAVVVFAIWLAALAWTVPYCYLNGYDRQPADLTLVLGMPDWVVWGILAPWGACWCLSLVFALWWMRDADLGTGDQGADDD
jgi:hypothetical protein